MDVRTFTVGQIAENCFIFRRDGADRALIVDPGDEADRILGAVDELGLGIDAILLTHTHFDHIGAVAPVAKATGAPVYCPEIEVPVLANIMSFTPPPFGPEPGVGNCFEGNQPSTFTFFSSEPDGLLPSDGC